MMFEIADQDVQGAEEEGDLSLGECCLYPRAHAYARKSQRSLDRSPRGNDLRNASPLARRITCMHSQKRCDRPVYLWYQLFFRAEIEGQHAESYYVRAQCEGHIC